MAADLERRTEEYIRRHQLLSAGETVCAGFSGGADSLCLLLLLAALRKRLGFRLCAAHVNHHLRGDASDADEAFVRAVCRSNDIPLRVFHCRADEAAEQLHCSVEEAGRLLRLEAWRLCIEQDGAEKIALAHHRNDQAETLLFRAARGTSLTGLAGIRPIQVIRVPQGETTGLLLQLPAQEGTDARGTAGITLIRPLLCAGREEIEEWLRERGAAWQTDATNREDICARNSIRHQVIPSLERQVNTETVRHLADLAEDADETDRFLQDEAKRRAGQYLSAAQDADGNAVFIRETLREEPPVMQNRIMMEAIRMAAGPARDACLSPVWEDGLRDMGREQLRQLRQLQAMPAGKEMALPRGLRAVREYDGIRLGRNPGTAGREKRAEASFAASEKGGQTIFLPAAAELSGKEECAVLRLGEWTFRVRVIPAELCPAPVPQKEYTKWLDYDKINECLVLRYRQPGDWLTVRADGGRKKLKDYLIDSRIPRRQRDTIPLLASGPEVFWAVGHRISERAKVGPGTERVLEITAAHRLKTGEDR